MTDRCSAFVAILVALLVAGIFYAMLDLCASGMPVPSKNDYYHAEKCDAEHQAMAASFMRLFHGD